jgi:tetratricopeptide (TPR) repeat protein
MSKHRLFDLIHEMRPSEKRYFKQYLKRHSNNSQETIYARFFDYIVQHKDYSKDHIFKKCSYIQPDQFQNIQSRLYNSILESLRAFNSTSSFRIQLSEHQVNAEILEKKGMFDEALQFLKKAEKLAEDNEKIYDLDTILTHQELLLTTRSKSPKHREQISKVQKRKAELEIQRLRQKELFAIRTEVYNYFRVIGRLARDPSSVVHIEQKYKEFDARFSIDQNSCIERQYYYCERSVLYRFKGELKKSLDDLEIIRSMYDENPKLKKVYETEYLKFLSDYIIVCNLNKKFKNSLEAIQLIRSYNDPSNKQKQLFIFETCFFFELEVYLYQQQYAKAVAFFQLNENVLHIFENNLHSVNQQSKLYRIALSYFGDGQYKTALRWLNKILNSDILQYRKDIIVSVRLLNILIHFELSNFSLLKNRLTTTATFIKKANRWLPSEKAFISAFNSIVLNQKNEIDAFTTLLKRLEEAENGNYLEHYFFNYFDFKHWVQVKIQQ